MQEYCQIVNVFLGKLVAGVDLESDQRELLVLSKNIFRKSKSNYNHNYNIAKIIFYNCKLNL